MKLPRIKLPSKLTQAVGKALLKTQAASPEICLVSGFILGGAALVLVGVETWKGKETLSEDFQEIKRYTKKNSDLNDVDRKKFFRTNLVIFAKDVVKVYCKPAILAVGSAGLILCQNRILRHELGVATTAFATLKNQYDNLVEKTRDEIGDEKVQELLYGAKDVDVLDAQSGEKIGQTTFVDTANMVSPYAFRFDDGEWDDKYGRYIWRNPVWNANKVINIAKVVSIQNDLNDLLKARGYVHENDARIAFGKKPIKRGWRYGWVLGSDGDGYIDFGVLPGPHQIPINKLFMDEKNSFNMPIIDLNVDGKIEYIYDDILEYDTNSNIAFAKRRQKKIAG